jgi:hypothetical protein
MICYEMTAYKVPFPGEKSVRPASDFKSRAPAVLSPVNGERL